MEKKKLKYRTVMIMVLFGLLLTACSGYEQAEQTAVPKEKEAEDQSWLVSSVGLGIQASDVFNICEKDGRIFMLATADQDTFLVACDLDGSNAEQVELPINKKETVGCMTVDGKSRLCILTYKDKKNGTEYYMKIMDEEGKIIDSHELKQNKAREKACFPGRNTAVVASDGSVYVLAGNQTVILFGIDGKEVNRIDCQMFASSIVQMEDGSIYIYGNGKDGYELRKLNIEGELTDERIGLGEHQIYNEEIYGGKDSIVYIRDQNNVYSFHVGDGTLSKLFGWADKGIDGANIRGYLPMGRRTFFAVSVPYGSEKAEMEAVIVKRTGDSEKKDGISGEKEKKVLTLACASINSGCMRENILKFNQINEDYQIQVNDYSEYENPWMQLNMDITSGKIPDIFCLNGLPVDLYVENGLLTDLYPFMEEDKEIRAEDFVDSVRMAAEKDGKLYYLGATFCLDECLTIGRNYIGVEEGWSIEDMERLYQEMPENSIFMQGMTKQLFVRQLVSYRMEDYLEKETGKVSFRSENFEKVLMFADHFQDEKEVVAGVTENAAKMVAEGTLMVYHSRLSGLTDISMRNTLYQNTGGYQVVGFPSEDKSSILAASFVEPAMAISEQCEEKEAAWEFLRQFFTYDYGLMASTFWHFPTRKDVLEKRLAYAMAEEEYTDGDGTMVTPMQGSMNFMDYNVKLNPLSEEDVAFVRSLIARIGKVSNESDDMQLAVLDIVQTEAESYFAGDKTAEETAEIIQNRVQLYVNENS